MICKRCGSELKPQAKFCPKCGEKVEQTKYCSNCGKVLESGVKFCSSCGKPAAEADNDAPVPRREETLLEETAKQDTPEILEAGNNADSSELKKEACARTLDTFKTELKELGDEDNGSKAVVLLFGTGVFYKHFYPLLRDDERLLTIRHIQSKTLFARYRKEFIALTDKRVIKFEKIQYFSPRVESLYYEEIKDVKSDEPSNAISGTFIGEKVCISSWDGRQINMRMVGKGEAKALEDQIMQEKQKHGDSLPNAIPAEASKPYIKMRKGKKKVFIVGGVIIAVLAVLIVWGIGSTATELSEYIPLARTDVMKFIEKNSMAEIMADFLYETDGLTITLNDNGNIDSLIIDSPEYSLYGMRVGNEFSPKDATRLAEHGYSFTGDYIDRIAVINGEQVIGITLDSAGLISKLEYMSTGSQDATGEENEISDKGLDTDHSTEEYFSPESSNRYLTEEEIAAMTDYEKIAVMYEIAARHGATFMNVDDGEQWQEYFNSKKWYTPSMPIEEMEDSILNEYEMANIINISDSVQGVMGITNQDYMILPESGSRYLTQEDLVGLDQETLRLARNEIYARHGRKFETEDLNEYFSRQPWYLGYLSAEEFDDAVLNEYEKANLDLIKKVETGSAEGDFVSQLKPEDVADSVYSSNNTGVTMEVGTYSDGGQIYAVFSNSSTELWRGEFNRYQNLEYGGIALMFNGRNAVTGEEDYLTVEWITSDSIDFPTVDYEFDTVGISDTYSYAYKLTGN